jgi:hypothetical protein
MPPTLISPRQLNTRELFSVQQILLSRGFEVTSTDTVEKLLLTEENQYDEIWKILYHIYFDTKLRAELKDFLYKKKAIQSEPLITLTNHPKFVNEYNRFDNTFEWFAGELMIEKFAALSAAFGVTVKNVIRNSTGTEAGDYDSLVVLRDTKLAYFECKAGGYDEASIIKCYERMLALNCEFSILFCSEPIDEKKLIWDTSKVRIPVVNAHDLSKINVKGNLQDIIYDLHNCYIVDTTGNVEDKLRTVLRINNAKINQLHYGFGLENETYGQLGYDMTSIDRQRYSEYIDSSITV